MFEIRKSISRLKNYSLGRLGKLAIATKNFVQSSLGVFGYLYCWTSSALWGFQLLYFDPRKVGHFLWDTMYSIAENNSGKYGTRLHCTLFPTGPVSNDFVVKLIERNFKFSRGLAPAVGFARFFGLNPDWLIQPAKMNTGAFDPDNLLSSTQTSILFEPEEVRFSYEMLRSLGWRTGDPIVCLMVRDSEYYPKEKSFRGPLDAYHLFRNADIDTFIPSVNWLLEKRAWVFRIGKRAEKRLRVRNSRVVDLPFSAIGNDFFEIWLLAHADLTISTGSGPDVASFIEGRPLALVNFLPLAHAYSSSDVLVAPKKLYRSGKRISLEANLRAYHTRGMNFYQDGIEIKDLSSQELLEVIQEAWRDVNNPNLAPQSRQVEPLCNIGLYTGERRIHGKIHPRFRLARAWLDVLEAELNSA